MEVREGFANQRMAIVPRPRVDGALHRPVTRRMLVTDVGWFGVAENHLRKRPEGAAEAIVIVCVSGSGWVETGGVRTRIGPSMGVVLPAGVPHSYGAAPTDAWTIWWCHLRGSDVGELVDATGAAPGRVAMSLRSPERVVALLDEICRTLSGDPSPAALTAAAGMGWRLLTQLAVDRTLPEDGGPLERAMRHLQERVEGTVRVPELAALVGVSASHLSALFREATGGGVTAYLTGLKMTRARALLDATHMPVAQVGREIGMADPYYFSRQFRKAHGMSPRAYRNMRKG